MRIEKLTIDHRDFIYEKLRMLSLPVSEYTFASLYLFRKKHNYEIIFDEEIFIRGTTYDGTSYIMPVFDLTKSDRNYVKKIISEFGILFPVPEDWLTALDPEIYNFSFNEDEIILVSPSVFCA